MAVINGRVTKGKMIDGVQHTFVDLSVDELCTDNTPRINFWTFCILNNLLVEDPENPGRYKPNIHLIELEESKDEEKNQRIYDMLDVIGVRYF